MHMCIYTYIYIERERHTQREGEQDVCHKGMYIPRYTLPVVCVYTYIYTYIYIYTSRLPCSAKEHGSGYGLSLGTAGSLIGFRAGCVDYTSVR